MLGKLHELLVFSHINIAWMVNSKYSTLCYNGRPADSDCLFYFGVVPVLDLSSGSIIGVSTLLLGMSSLWQEKQEDAVPW